MCYGDIKNLPIDKLLKGSTLIKKLFKIYIHKH